MAQPAVKNISIEDYLEAERMALEKHEYYKGEIFAMSGASIPHNRIQSNIIREVGNALKGKSCDVFGSDLRINIPSNSLFTYPDVVIVCGELETLDNAFDTVLNPTVIIEILSPSTQSYDRGDKFNLYRAIDSLKEYILIASESVGIEHYAKQPNGQWLLQEWSSMEASLSIHSIDVSLPLKEIYTGIQF